MIEIIFELLISAIAVYVTASVLPGVSLSGFGSAIWLAIVLALLNTFLKPVFVFLTIPLTLITFGLFLLVINTVVVLIAGKLLKGFHLTGFWPAFLFALILSVTTSLLECMFDA